jgi:hypothetical protein
MSKTEPKSFTMLEGTPTITFVTSEIQRMVPYHSFVTGSLEHERITLQFGDLLVQVEGEALDELWEGLQLQDVRSICAPERRSATLGECSVTRISMRNTSDSELREAVPASD